MKRRTGATRGRYHFLRSARCTRPRFVFSIGCNPVLRTRSLTRGDPLSFPRGCVLLAHPIPLGLRPSGIPLFTRRYSFYTCIYYSINITIHSRILRLVAAAVRAEAQSIFGHVRLCESGRKLELFVS